MDGFETLTPVITSDSEMFYANIDVFTDGCVELEGYGKHFRITTAGKSYRKVIDDAMEHIKAFRVIAAGGGTVEGEAVYFKERWEHYSEKMLNLLSESIRPVESFDLPLMYTHAEGIQWVMGSDSQLSVELGVYRKVFSYVMADSDTSVTCVVNDALAMYMHFRQNKKTAEVDQGFVEAEKVLCRELALGETGIDEKMGLLMDFLKVYYPECQSLSWDFPEALTKRISTL